VKKGQSKYLVEGERRHWAASVGDESVEQLNLPHACSLALGHSLSLHLSPSLSLLLSFPLYLFISLYSPPSLSPFLLQFFIVLLIILLAELILLILFFVYSDKVRIL
jgi:hypothetical protein